jgi:hypothetical protein
MRFSLLAAVPAVLAFAGRAFAQGDPPPADPQAAPAPAAATPAPAPSPVPAPTPEQKEEPKDHSVAILVSPLHLILPVVEITAEIRLHERIGVAVIGGIGSIDPYQFEQTKPPPGVKTGRFTVWELGGQFVTYPVGHFDHGMQLGAELLYAGVAGDAESATNSASGTAQGLSMGPFIGYKFTAKVGFSLALQGGVAYLTARADVKDAQGNTASSSDSEFGPLININLGWAF